MNSRAGAARFATLLLERVGSRPFVGLALVVIGAFVLWVGALLPPSIPLPLRVASVAVGLVMIVLGMLPVGKFIFTVKNPEFDS